jgi:imidazolonepropionase-like amidohydrolase
MTRHLVIRPGSLIDSVGEHARTGLEVLVTDGLIADVRPVGTTPAPTDAQVIEAPGQTLMAGLIDLHMHVFQWKQRRDQPRFSEPILNAGLRGISNASELLDLGVTTARDVGCRDNLNIQLRNLIRTGAVRGPRFLASGTQLAAAGRAAYLFPTIDISGMDEARAAARRQLRAGADWLKVMATSGVGGGTGQLIGEPGWQELTEAELRAAADEAHMAGRKITSHAIGRDGIKAALRAGVDCIEHGNYMDDECIDLMLERNVGYVPTLIITKNLGEHGLERHFEANIVERAKRTLEAGLASVNKAFQAGVRIATGSDVDLDETAADEIRMLRIAGLSPMESLKAATITAASIIDMADTIGSIEPGKIADLILLDGDPLTDDHAVDRVTHVIQGGTLVKSPHTTH